jgi:hypothetical protein
MKNKKIFYFGYLVGIISLFMPYYESFFIACGLGSSVTGYEYVDFFHLYINNIKFLKIEFLDFIDIMWQSLFLISIVFSPLFYIYKKHLMLILLCFISILYFVLSFVNAYDMLVWGFYILFFQQLFMLSLLIQIYRSQTN